MSRDPHASESRMIALTAMRLPLVVLLIATARSMPYLAVAVLVLVVLADILDGAIARRLGLDTPSRRIADVTVDKLVIHSALIPVVLGRPEALPWYALILLRDLVAAIGYWRLILNRHVVVVGASLHRCSSLGDAAFFLSLLFSHSPLVIISGALACSVNYILLLDFAGVYVRLACAGPPARPAPLSRFTTRGIDGLWSLGALVANHLPPRNETELTSTPTAAVGR